MSWNTSALEGTAHVHCPACSPEVLRTYSEDGVNFLLKAIREPKYVEELCGISYLKTLESSDDILGLDLIDETDHKSI